MGVVVIVIAVTCLAFLVNESECGECFSPVLTYDGSEGCHLLDLPGVRQLSSLVFFVKGTESAAIGMTATQDGSARMFWIGRDNNSMSSLVHILVCGETQKGYITLLEAKHHPALSATEFLPFWIKWHFHDVALGTGTEVGENRVLSTWLPAMDVDVDALFLSGHDHNPYMIYFQIDCPTTEEAATPQAVTTADSTSSDHDSSGAITQPASDIPFVDPPIRNIDNEATSLTTVTTPTTTDSDQDSSGTTIQQSSDFQGGGIGVEIQPPTFVVPPDGSSADETTSQKTNEDTTNRVMNATNENTSHTTGTGLEIVLPVGETTASSVGSDNDKDKDNEISTDETPNPTDGNNTTEAGSNTMTTENAIENVSRNRLEQTNAEEEDATQNPDTNVGPGSSGEATPTAGTASVKGGNENVTWDSSGAEGPHYTTQHEIRRFTKTDDTTTGDTTTDHTTTGNTTTDHTTTGDTTTDHTTTGNTTTDHTTTDHTTTGNTTTDHTTTGDTTTDHTTTGNTTTDDTTTNTTQPTRAKTNPGNDDTKDGSTTTDSLIVNPTDADGPSNENPTAGDDILRGTTQSSTSDPPNAETTKSSEETGTNDVIPSTSMPTFSKAQTGCNCVQEMARGLQGDERERNDSMGQRLEEMKAALSEAIVQELSVPSANLSARVRKKVSAQDERPSSRVVGTALGVVCFTPVVLLVLSDLVAGVTFLWARYTPG